MARVVHAVASVVCVGSMSRVGAYILPVPTVTPMASMGGVCRGMTRSVHGTMLNLVTFVGPCLWLMFILLMPGILCLSSLLMSIRCFMCRHTSISNLYLCCFSQALVTSA